jgi:hypothetical protein
MAVKEKRSDGSFIPHAMAKRKEARRKSGIVVRNIYSLLVYVYARKTG